MLSFNHKVIKDFISLIANRGLDSLISIVIIPYLIARIGDVEYGKIIVAQSIIYIGVAIINYGTDLLILKKIPEYVEFQKQNGLSILISRIFCLRFLLFIVFFIATLLIAYFFINELEIKSYINIFLLLCLSEIISVSHVLVAFHNVRILPRISLIRFLFIFIFTLIFVKNEADSIWYVFLFSFSYFLSNLSIAFCVFHKYRLRFYLISSFETIKTTFLQSSPFFISRLNLLLSDKLYNILSATFISLSTAALLDISFKVLSVFIIPIQILSTIILGWISIRASQVLMRKVLWGICIFGILLFVILVLVQKYILLYYSFPLSFNICASLSIILFSSIFANLSIFIGENIMVSHSLERPLIKSSIYASLFIFPLLIIAISIEPSIIILSIFFLLHKMCELSLRLFYSWKHI